MKPERKLWLRREALDSLGTVEMSSIAGGTTNAIAVGPTPTFNGHIVCVVTRLIELEGGGDTADGCTTKGCF